MTATGSTTNSTMRQAVRQRLFRRLLTAQAISQAGNWLYNVALLAVVYDRTHSATWVAITTAARVLPIVVGGPFGGVLADRLDRRRVMIGSDCVQAVAMLVLAAVASAGWPIVLAPVLAAAATLAAAPYPACVAASTPRLVPGEQLAGANAARSAVNSACIVVGPALGGLLLAMSSATIAFALNAASFALSAVLVASLPAGKLSRSAVTDGEAERPHVFADLVTGLRALRSSRTALRLVGADTSCSVVYGAQTVLFVLLARALGYGADGYGWLLAGAGLGGILGAALAPRLANVGRSELVMAAALVAVAAPLPLFAFTSVLAIAVVLAVIGGAGAICIEVLADTGLQSCLPEDVLGRAYGFAIPAAIGGIAVGSLVAAPLVTALGAHGALFALGAAVLVHAAVLARPVLRRATPQHTAAPEEIVLPVPIGA